MGDRSAFARFVVSRVVSGFDLFCLALQILSCIYG